MGKESPVFRLVILFLLIFAGVILGMIYSILPGVLQGISMDEIIANASDINSKSASELRLSLFSNHLFLFLLPSLVYGIYVFGKDIMEGFSLKQAPHVIFLGLGVLFLYLAYPLVTFAFYINSLIPLADWMVTTEQDVAAMLGKILNSDNPYMIIINVMLISVMPAIGEELIFRGIIQKNLEKIFKNGHIAVWVAAVIFSAIHFQFEGFLARMVLGATMGYIYYYTRNLWVAMFVHFVNNIIPVLAFMIYHKDLTETESLKGNFDWISLLIPIIGIPLIYYIFQKYGTKHLNKHA